MDTRSSAIRIVAAFFLVMVFLSIGFSNPTHIYTGNFNLPIPANPDDTNGWMADAVIEVPHHFIIADLDVRINITHTRVFDLQLFLQSPTDARICLNMYDPFYDFFDGANYTDTIFDDEAPFSIEDGNVPFVGRFRPLEPYKLSEFDGQNTFGTWLLQIYDMWPTDTGTLNSFDLMITAPEPASAILLTLGVGLVGLFRPRRGH
jgi:hypothetical protein